MCQIVDVLDSVEHGVINGHHCPTCGAVDGKNADIEEAHAYLDRIGINKIGRDAYGIGGKLPGGRLTLVQRLTFLKVFDCKWCGNMNTEKCTGCDVENYFKNYKEISHF